MYLKGLAHDWHIENAQWVADSDTAYTLRADNWEMNKTSLSCYSSTLPLLHSLCSIFLSSTTFFFVWQKESLPVFVPFATLLSPSTWSPLPPLSSQLSNYPSLSHWTPSVILPILFPLTRGMTKTVSHLFQAHLYSLYKCIRQPCFMKQNTLNRSFSWWLRVVSMNTNDYSAYTVIGAIEVYWLLVLMLNGFLLKFIVKKNPAFPDKGRYVLSSDNETYLCCPCFMQTYVLSFTLYFSGVFFVWLVFCFLLLKRVGKKLTVQCC